MAQVQCEIDSIRVVATSPDEAQPDSEEEDRDSHVPIFMSQQQGETLASKLHGRPDGKKELDAFLVSHNAPDSDLDVR